MAVVLSCALWATTASADNGISYHNGLVMAGTSDVYVIWYGNWTSPTGPNSAETQTIVGNFLGSFGGSIPAQINFTYGGVNGAPSGGTIYGGGDVVGYTHGMELDAAAIQAIVSDSLSQNHLPLDSSGIYLVMASSDVGSTATGFCTPNAPPYHGSFIRNSQAVKYAFIGNPARCPSVAAPQFFAPNGSQLATPNGNLAADAMVSTATHALDTTITDPFRSAWYDSAGLENADKCSGSFSHTLTLGNGARYNFTYNGGQDKYLIQDNWVNNYGGYCSQQNDAPPRPDDQTIQVTQDTPKSITLTAVDDNGDQVTFAVITPPRHGTLTGSGATRTYTPAASYHGLDSFTFKANDGTLDSQTVATVSIFVNTNSALDGFDPNANGLVRVAAVQPDGKILIGGDFTTLAPNGRPPVTRNYIARVNVDGTLDPTFNPSANSSVRAIALLPDGKIILGGDFSAFAPNGGASINRTYVVRLNADGTIDATFDSHPNGPVHAVTVQADGNTVIGGEFTGFFNGGPLVTRNRIARVNTDGTLDPIFNPNANSTVDALVGQPDGRIIVGGRFTTLTPVAGAGALTRNYIARLNVDGTVDQSFDPNPDSIVGSLAIQPDGKVLLGGAFAALGPNGGAPVARNHLARMNVNGTLDTTFNPSPNSFVQAIVIQPDGRILIGGGFTSLAPNGGASVLHKYIARLNPDGTLAPGVDPAPNDQVFTIAVQSDGKIVVGGVFQQANSFGGQARNRIARLETDGRVDQTLNLNALGGSVTATAVQPDGKILIAGSFNSILGVTRKFIARLNTDGTLDTTFDPNANEYVGSIAIQSDGKILIGGEFTMLAPNGGPAVARNYIARLNIDGTVDATFNPNPDDFVNAIAIQTDGKILLGGFFITLAPNGGVSFARGCIARLNLDGTLDNTFNPNANSDVFAITVQPDGKILLGGRFTALAPNALPSVPRNFVARVNSDGTLDNAFDPNANDRVNAFAMQPDGKLLIGGSFTTLAPNGGLSITRNRIARLNVDGTIDNAFNPNADNAVASVALQADGRILAGGAFTTLAPNGGTSQARNGFARLNADGTVDAFDPQPNNEVCAISVLPDGKILLGGTFDSVGGQSRKIFARLANDTPAIQNLAVTQSTVTWTRSGAEPQLVRVTFEKSSDGVNYTSLGNGARVGTSNDFTLTGQSLPVQQNLYVRARGFYRGGQYNTADSIAESVRNVFLPPAWHLAFAQQPANAPQNNVITPAVTVQILDASNNLVNSSAAVTVSLGTNPSTGTLSGTKTVSAASGTAVFNNLSIDKLGSGYTLSASGTNMTGAVSNAFNITVNAPSNIVATAGLGQSATINSAFASALQAKVTDVNANPVAGVLVTFSAPASGASGVFANNTTTTTAATDANGVAAASSFTANGTAGLYAISASINAGSPATAFGMTNLKANQTISVTTHAPAGGAAYNTQFSVTATSSSGLPVSYSSSGACTNNGATFTMTNGTGNCTVKYDQAGDANRNAAPSITETVTAKKLAQSITFDAVASKAFGDSDFTVNGSSSSGLNINYAANGNCTNSGSTVHLTGTGSCSITASQAGNSFYEAATEVVRSFNIAKAGSTTSVTVGDAIYDGSAHGGTANATGAGGLSEKLTVTYSGRNGTNYSSETAPTNAGDYTASASYNGDANHSGSSDSKDFAIGKAAQTIDFGALPDKTFGDADFAVGASASSALAVNFATSGQCSIPGASVHVEGAGSCTITASQSGDANHDSAPDVKRSFQISKASTTTQLSYSSDAGSGQATFAATVTSPAGTPNGTITFLSDGAAITSCGAPVLASGLAKCVDSATIGVHTFTAEYSGDANFNASTGSVSGGLAGSIFEFSQAAYVVGERNGSITISVKRSGDASQAASVDYMTDDGSVPSVVVPCSRITGVALERCDYTRAAGTLEFAPNETEKSFVVLVNDDSYAEGPESISLKLSNPGSGAVLGSQANATVQITDDATESADNPVDDDTNYVRQQYHDFLNREADPDGLSFWSHNIAQCDTDECGARKRVDTSAAFYLSIEFQETGYLVERFYKSAYGDATGGSNLGGPHQLPVPIVRLREFLHDTQEIGQGVIVNQSGWQQQLENRKQAFAREFVSRERFRNAYPDSLNAEQFVAQLNANAGGALSDAEMTQLESVFGGPSGPSADDTERAQVLRSIAENATLHQREFNRAFVLMQYFGYLRRNPDDAQDSDYTGYDFWVQKMEQFGGNYIDAEMVKAFVTSSEYRQRFGQ